MPLHIVENVKNVGTFAIWKLTENEEELLQIRPLSKQEHNEFSCLKNNKRRKEWLIIRILLEKLAGKNVSLHYLSNGKPVLLKPELFVSISHSSNFVAVFISSSRPIGIDIEKIKENIGLLKNKFLLPEESLQIDDADNQLLHIYWGAKEAMYKMYSDYHLLFTNHLSVSNIDYKNGTATGKIQKEDFCKTISLIFRQIEDNLLVYCFEKM